MKLPKINPKIIKIILITVIICLYFFLMSQDQLWQWFLSHLFPDEKSVLHPRFRLIDLVLDHLFLVFISSFFSILVGVCLGIFVTRRSNQEFKDLIDQLSAVGQTFPPVAILALSVPLLGFGILPTVFALFIFGLLPIVRNTIVGIESISYPVLDAAKGMGMTQSQILFRIELPLSSRVILAGVKTSLIINIGTATIGATIGAGGLGIPIIAGLVGQNSAFILEGAIPAALLAFLFDFTIKKIEEILLEKK